MTTAALEANSSWTPSPDPAPSINWHLESPSPATKPAYNKQKVAYPQSYFSSSKFDSSILMTELIWLVVLPSLINPCCAECIREFFSMIWSSQEAMIEVRPLVMQGNSEIGLWSFRGRFLPPSFLGIGVMVLGRWIEGTGLPPPRYLVSIMCLERYVLIWSSRHLGCGSGGHGDLSANILIGRYPQI